MHRNVVMVIVSVPHTFINQMTMNDDSYQSQSETHSK